MPTLHNPHDKFFKTSMRRDWIAKDFLARYLPEWLKPLVDLDTLQLQSGNYLDPDFQVQESDLVYQVAYQPPPECLAKGKRSARKGPWYAYILVEHQSTVDHHMPYRMLRYTVSLWGEHLKNRPHEKLPLVIPILFYTGKKPYNGPTEVGEMLECPKRGPVLFVEPYLCIQAQTIPDSLLVPEADASMMLYVMKHILDRKPHGSFGGYWHLLQAMLKKRQDQDYWHSTMRYILENTRHWMKKQVIPYFYNSEDPIVNNFIKELIGERQKKAWLEEWMQDSKSTDDPQLNKLIKSFVGERQKKAWLEEWVQDSKSADDPQLNKLIKSLVGERQKKAWLEEWMQNTQPQWAQEAENRGEQRGKALGEQLGIKKNLLYLLEKKFHTVPPDYAQLIAQASHAELMEWTGNVLDSPTLEGVFGERAD